MRYVLNFAFFSSMFTAYRYASSRFHGRPFRSEWPMIRFTCITFAFVLAALYFLDAHADLQRVDVDDFFGEFLLTQEKTHWYLDKVNQCHCNATVALEEAYELAWGIPEYAGREAMRAAIYAALPAGHAAYRGNVKAAAVVMAIEVVAVYLVKCYDRYCDIMDLLIVAKSEAQKAEDYAAEMLRLRRHPRLID